MKKSVVIKMFLLVLLVLTLIISSNHVQAVDNTTGYQDLTQAASGNNTNNSNTSNTNTTNTNNTAKNNTSLNTGALTNNTNKANNVNTSLPKTGVEDSIPTMLLLVVFGISAIYAYKKIKEYKNI